MEKLLKYIVKGITGKNTFSIKTEEADAVSKTKGDFVRFVIKAPKDIIGLIIGKKGKTIRMIRNLLRVKATLDKKGVSVSVEET